MAFARIVDLLRNRLDVAPLEVVQNDQSRLKASCTVRGWVRTKRGNKNVAFIALNDGSVFDNIQIVVDLATIPEENLLGRVHQPVVSVCLCISFGQAATWKDSGIN